MKKVSIAVPCRNEENHIINFLKGMENQNYPKKFMEIVIADGDSDDNTKKIIKDFAGKNPDLKIKLVRNKKKITPAAYNVAVKSSTGEYIMTSGAHSQISQNYVSRCVEYLDTMPDIDCVGGSVETLPSTNSLVAKAIAISLSHPFGTGNAKFRNKIRKPLLVDTVYHGCYRREVFEKNGYYDERLLRSQDLDLNLRIIKNGGKILLAPDLKIKYYPKNSFKEIFIYHYRCGLWVPRAAKLTKTRYKIRHYLPLLVFLVGLILLIGSLFSVYVLTSFVSLAVIYFTVNLLVSTGVAIRGDGPKMILPLMIAFFLRHFSFGLGSFVGLVYCFNRILIS